MEYGGKHYLNRTRRNNQIINLQVNVGETKVRMLTKRMNWAMCREASSSKDEK